MAPHQHTLAQYGLRTASDATGQPVITHLPVCANQRPLSQGVNQLVSCLRQGGSVVAAVASMIDATTLLQWLSHHAEPWQSQAHYVIPDSKITNALRPRRPIAEFGESRPPHRPVPPQSR